MIADYEMLVTAVRNLIENAIVYSEQHSQVGWVSGLSTRLPRLQSPIRESGFRNLSRSASLSASIGSTHRDREKPEEPDWVFSIVKHAAANHRGEVKMFSKEGVGSTFTLRLPIDNEGA
jgi:two-component system, OmpR family, sensor histidine kinase SenX3